jgi:hypothetical protein
MKGIWIAGLAFLLGCGGSSTAPESTPGRYILGQVNSNFLPYGNYTSGYLDVRTDGTYGLSVNNGIEDPGTWIRSGGAFTIHSAAGDTWPGTITNKTIFLPADNLPQHQISLQFAKF